MSSRIPDVALVNLRNRVTDYQVLGSRLTEVEPPVWAGLGGTFLRRKGFDIQVLPVTIPGEGRGWHIPYGSRDPLVKPDRRRLVGVSPTRFPGYSPRVPLRVPAEAGWNLGPATILQMDFRTAYQLAASALHLLRQTKLRIEEVLGGEAPRITDYSAAGALHPESRIQQFRVGLNLLWMIAPRRFERLRHIFC